VLDRVAGVELALDAACHQAKKADLQVGHDHAPGNSAGALEEATA